MITVPKSRIFSTDISVKFHRKLSHLDSHNNENRTMVLDWGCQSPPSIGNLVRCWCHIGNLVRCQWHIGNVVVIRETLTNNILLSRQLCPSFNPFLSSDAKLWAPVAASHHPLVMCVTARSDSPNKESTVLLSPAGGKLFHFEFFYLATSHILLRRTNCRRPHDRPTSLVVTPKYQGAMWVQRVPIWFATSILVWFLGYGRANTYFR